GHGFAAVERARRPRRDVARYFDGVAVEVEKAEPVAAARRIETVRLRDQLDAVLAEFRRQRIDIAGAVGGEADHVDAAFLGAAQPRHELLARPFGAEIGKIAVRRDLVQAPRILEEVPFGGEIRPGEADIAQLGDAGIAHGACLRRVRVTNHSRGGPGGKSYLAIPTIPSSDGNVLAFPSRPREAATGRPDESGTVRPQSAGGASRVAA